MSRVMDMTTCIIAAVALAFAAALWGIFQGTYEGWHPESMSQLWIAAFFLGLVLLGMLR